MKSDRTRWAVLCRSGGVHFDKSPTGLYARRPGLLIFEEWDKAIGEAEWIDRNNPGLRCIPHQVESLLKEWPKCR